MVSNAPQCYVILTLAVLYYYCMEKTIGVFKSYVTRRHVNNYKQQDGEW
jgi:hypothetical protein